VSRSLVATISIQSADGVKFGTAYLMSVSFQLTVGVASILVVSPVGPWSPAFVILKDGAVHTEEKEERLFGRR